MSDAVDDLNRQWERLADGVSPKNALKLFRWESVEARAEWAPGQAFAWAESKAQAIDLICESFEGDDEMLRAELNGSEPTISDGPVGFTIWGSA